MFCSNCGKQLPDNAVFCSGCGARMGGAPADNAAPAGAPAGAPYGAPAGAPYGAPQPAPMPPIFKRLIEQVVGFFTRKDPVGVVAHSSRDNTWSGAIVLAVGMLITALASMINFNQGINSLVNSLIRFFSEMLGGIGGISGIPQSYIAQLYPSGATFGLSLLGAAVIAVATIAMVFVAVNYVSKRQLPLVSVVNMVAYSSLPLVVAFLLNMILGLIWLPLAIVLTIVAALATLFLLYSAVTVACGYEKAPFGAFMIVVAALAIVAILFSYIWIKGGIDNIVNKLGGIERLLDVFS
ncbi:MAG: zinc ribbon domain-containing protein [Clostridia bacterium]|nr:zinc ribbon domain-containing protein [Clostridia bacterium]